MDLLTAKKTSIIAVYLLMLCFDVGANGYNSYMLEDGKSSYLDLHFVPRGVRMRRDTPVNPSPQPAPIVPMAEAKTSAPPHTDDDSNRTINVSSTVATPASAAVTQIPPLGKDGHGILKDTTIMPRVSDPISISDDNITADVFTKETPEILKAQQNITDLKFDNHDFYNSTFIGNKTYFEEYWANITKVAPSEHAVLSNSHRRATTVRLTFTFPFYGHPLHNITVATGGFIYTGEHVHNWLAATQYIAPLMANFDTTLTNDSYIKMVDDGEKFTAFWENVTLQEDKNAKFTFAVTLFKNGDIVFAYKTIPIPIQNINDNDHPVKVGISDAYLTDKILFLIRRKTIFEYHRVSLKDHEITNGTILKLIALPTCLQYTDCQSCVTHNTAFNCMWCEAIRKCSSGTDRNKQDWIQRSCHKNTISNLSSCPAVAPYQTPDNGGDTSYITDSKDPYHSVVSTLKTPEAGVVPEHPANATAGAGAGVRAEESVMRDVATPAHRSSVGGVVGALVALALVVAAAAWALYAFKNPHTRSGQLIIKYRPSQWSWRRGEARYTAATIHM